MRRRGGAYDADDMRAIVAAYITDYQDRSKEEWAFFASQSTLAATVRLAGLAEGPKSKRMSHQRRIPRSVLRESAGRLLRRLGALKRSRSFEQLHDVVAATIGPIPGIGDLTVYDTAIRIAAHRNLSPKRVYLHAGTREGARALGVSRDREWVMPRELPRELRRLRPMEIEDCLCIYKADLRALANGRVLVHGERGRRGKC